MLTVRSGRNSDVHEPASLQAFDEFPWAFLDGDDRRIRCDSSRYMHRARTEVVQDDDRNPQNLLTPDKVETRIGTLKFTDGYPDADTVQKVFDNLDFQRGVSVFLNAQAVPSLLMNLEGMRSIGISGQTAGVFEGLVDSKTLAPLRTRRPLASRPIST